MDIWSAVPRAGRGRELKKKKLAVQNGDRSWECRRAIYQGLNYCPILQGYILYARLTRALRMPLPRLCVTLGARMASRYTGVALVNSMDGAGDVNTPVHPIYTSDRMWFPICYVFHEKKRRGY